MSTGEITIENTTEPKLGGQFLSFFLDEEEYGIEIVKVQEIIGIMPITRVPLTPETVRGVANLRGKIIPITDLRTRLGMGDKETSEESCIIVVQTRGIEIGVIVDKVSEVIDIPGDAIEDVPTFGVNSETEFLLGIGNTDGVVRLLIDIDSILTHEESDQLKTMAHGNIQETVQA